MARTRRLVLDLLKPHEPSSVEFARRVADVEGVSGVNATLIEIYEEVENIKLTVEGDDVDFEAVEGAVDDLGGVVHSVDQVVCGETMVEESGTPQE